MNTNNLKIGFDSKRAFLNGSGLGNYSRTLINNLVNFFPENEYHLFTPKLSKKYFKTADSFKTHTPSGNFNKTFTSFWRSYSATFEFNKLNLNIFHGLSNELPQNIIKFKGKKIVTIHDLIFLRYPKMYKPLDRKIYEKKFKNACENADVIIAISEQTKNDIIDFFGTSSEKIKVVYQAFDARYLKPIVPEELIHIKEKYKLPQDFLLFVSTLEERKNVQSIIKAMADMPHQILVVVGRKTLYFKEIQSLVTELKLNNRVFFLDKVSNADLTKIYSLAKVFIYPSLFEGFGIPIIEALASKVPVITTTGGCFPEAGGKGALYTTYGDVEELKHNITSLIENNDLRNRLIDEGKNHILNFYPEKTTVELINLYKSL